MRVSTFTFQNEPSISFSPDRSRFESVSGFISSVGSMDMSDLLTGNKDQTFNSTHPQKSGFEDKVSGSGTHLQRRLERHIAHANASNPSSKDGRDSSQPPTINPESRNGKFSVHIISSPHHSSSGLDSRTKALLPPQRLAIPRKPTTNLTSTHSNSQEAKPLVQWDTDDR